MTSIIHRFRRKTKGAQEAPTSKTPLRAAEEALVGSEEMLRIFCEFAPTAILLYQHDRYVCANAAAESISGYTLQELLAMNYWDFIHPDHVAAIREHGRGRKDEGAVFPPYEAKLVTKSGQEKWVEICGNTMTFRGAPAGIVSVIDITKRVQAREALRDSRRRFQDLLETLCDWVWEVDQDGRYTYVSPQVKDILGYEPEEIIGTRIYDWMPAGEARRVRDEAIPLMTRHEPIIGMENINIRKDGQVVVLETNGLPFFDDDGNYRGYRGTDRDVTERKRAEEQIQHLASHDRLTNLPSRSLAMDRLAMAISVARRQGAMGAVMFVDLDGFKEVNDTLGHDAGDQVLKQVAQRLLSCGRETDTVAREGGDEFLFIANGLQTSEDATKIARKIVQCMSQPFSLGDQQPVVSASVGIALFPKDGSDAEDLIKLADRAMYEVKAAGKNAYRFADTAE